MTSELDVVIIGGLITLSGVILSTFIRPLIDHVFKTDRMILRNNLDHNSTTRELKIKHKLERINNSVNSLSLNMGSVKSTVNGLRENVKRIDGTVTALETHVDNIDHELKSNKGRMALRENVIESRLCHLEDNISQFISEILKITNLETRIENLEERKATK